MKLAGFRLYRYRLPLADPLALKGATLRHREGVLLRLAGEDGAGGWGEASPLPGFSREGIEEATRRLRELCSRMVGREVEEGWTDPSGTLSRELDAARLVPSARFAFELAAWNLLSAATGRGLHGLVSERPDERVRVNALLSGPPGRVLGEARRLREAGYGAFKLKVGVREVREEAALVRDLEAEIGDAVLRLDANRAWSFEKAAEFARAAEGARFEYVEEPLSGPERLPELVEETGMPVALDESLAGMEPGDLGEHGYARAVVLKPTLLGGISHTLRFAGAASGLGMKPVVSGAYETGVGTAALVALAAGIGGEVHAGLDTYRRLAEDVVSPPLDLPVPEIDVRKACARREIVCRYLAPFG